MKLKTTPLVLLLAALFVCVAYLAFSEKSATEPTAPEAKPEKTSRQADTPLSRLLGDIESPANFSAQTANKTIPLESFWRRFGKEFKPPPLSEDQLQRHLNMQGRSVSSLLTALRISENLDYLREAYDRYPDDPDVLLELAMRSESPEERREAIDAIRKLDPDWGLPDYLLALEQAKAGDRQAAMRTFLEAGSNKFLDYSILETSEEIEQVYLDNGFPLHEAKFLGIMTIPLSSVKPLLELAKEMNSLQADFLKKGDTASALELAQAARSLNQQKQAEAFTIVENLVGDAFEVSLLKRLPPTTDLGSGVTAGQRLVDLRTKKDQKKQIIKAASLEKTFGGMNEQDLINYVELIKTQGEWDTFLQWKAKGR